MSLYYDAAAILSSSEQRGSLKSLVYAKNSTFKSKPAHVFALISEAAKYDTLIKEVVDNAGILALEPKLTPVLALLLVQDHFFAKSGIAASAGHPLRKSIEKHKARLQSEFTRARLRRKAESIEQLKEKLNAGKGNTTRSSPRWARVNSLKTSLDDLLSTEFAHYSKVESVEEVLDANSSQKKLHIDLHIPNLIAFPPDQDLIKIQAYTEGRLILQDKASCFPACLLLGGTKHVEIGDVIDGCAAPGNKTTHTAAILSGSHGSSTIYACERDAARSKTLQSMVNRAGADNVITVLSRQDFLALNPDDGRFAKVTHLLLDPSCSGSGILGREDIPKLNLPKDIRNKKDYAPAKANLESKKRKREPESKFEKVIEDGEEDVTSEAQPLAVDKVRLEKLSTLQSLIVEHAFRFPSATRITYSTCSVHEEENEQVVYRVLHSDIAVSRGWRVLRRDEQAEGLQGWKQRGVAGKSSSEGQYSYSLSEEETQACIRCSPADDEGTMGFFVCGFVRDVGDDAVELEAINERNGTEDGEEWEGFSDS